MYKVFCTAKIRTILLMLGFIIITIACTGTSTVEEIDNDISDKETIDVFTDLVSKGTESFNNRDYSSAIRNFNEAQILDLKRFKNSREVLVKRGEAYRIISTWGVDQERPQKCRPGPACKITIDNYRLLVTLDSSNAEAHYWLGVALSNAELYQEAIDSFTQAIDLQPKDGYSYLRRGFALMNLTNDVSYGNYNSLVNQPAEAMIDFNLAAQLNPDNSLVYTYRGKALLIMGNPDKAIDDFNRAINLQEDTPSLFFDRATAFKAAKLYNDALSDFNLVLEWEPYDVKTLVERGDLKREMGQIEEAILDLEKAISLDFENPKAFVKFGNLRRETGELEMAIGNYDLALSFDTQNTEALLGRGKALYYLGHYDRAVLDFRYVQGLTRRDPISEHTNLLALEPGNISARLARGLEYLKNGNNSKALEDFNLVLSSNPDDTIALVGRGDVFKNFLKFDEAITDYSSAISIDDNIASGYRGRGEAKYHLALSAIEENNINSAFDKLTESLVDLKYLIQIFTADQKGYIAVSLALKKRGDVLRSLGRFEEAIKDYSNAIDFNRQDPDLFAGRSVAQAATGLYEESDIDANIAISLGFNKFLLDTMLEVARIKK